MQQNLSFPRQLSRSLRMGHRRLSDVFFRGVTAALVLVVLGIIGAVVWVLVSSSWQAILFTGWSFFTNTALDPIHNSFGVAPAIFGTLVTSAFALLLAVPIGVGTAIFLIDFCPRPLQMPLAFVVELLAAVPSVIYGLFGFLVLAPWLQTSGEPWLQRYLGWLPFFQGQYHGPGGRIRRMSTTSEPGGNPFQTLRTVHQLRRQVSNLVLILFSVLVTAFAVAVLIFLLLYVLRAGLPYINLDLFTKIPTPNGEGGGGGMANAIQGSLILIGLASLFGVPLGLFTGIYLSEFGRGPLPGKRSAFSGGCADGHPDHHLWPLCLGLHCGTPAILFGPAGSVALGIIMIPIVARTSEEVLRLVPQELREASLALGATESRPILRVVIPAACNGIITGIVLAMARVAEETAPLLMTAFGNPFFNADVTQPMDALPLRIFNFAESPYQTQINQAYAGSLVLIVLIMLTSFAIRWATGGFRRESQR